MGEVIKVVVGITVCLVLVKSCLTVDLEEVPTTPDTTSPSPSSGSTVESPVPAIPASPRTIGATKPEEKTMYLNYKKGEPPVAITCREVAGKVVCKPAK